MANGTPAECIPDVNAVEELRGVLESGGALTNTASLTGTNAAPHATMLDNGTVDFAAPHFPRNANWVEGTDDRIISLRNGLSSPAPIHLQEENRRGYPENNPCESPGSGVPCEEADFLRASELASSAGAAGWVFHTDAGFRLDQGRFRNALDSVEVAVLDCDVLDEIECLVEQVSESRCGPSSLIYDAFLGPPAGGFLERLLVHHATDRGVHKWRASGNHALDRCPENEVPACDKGPMTGSYITTNNVNSNATGWVPLPIPEGFTGTISVEADLTVGALVPFDSAVVSLGFLADEDCAAGGTSCSFQQKGEIWLEQGATGINFYDSNGIVGVMDWPTLVPTVRHWLLQYNYSSGQLSATLTGGGTTTFGGPIAVPSIRAVGFEILLGTRGISGVDNFQVKVTPGLQFGS
jgi:hypothetical protein